MALHSAAVNRAAQKAVEQVSVLLKWNEPCHLMRQVLGGSGVAYAVTQEKYGQAALAWFLPGAYAGYHLFRNREAVRAMVTNTNTVSH